MRSLTEFANHTCGCNGFIIFRKFKPTYLGTIYAFLAGCLVLAFVQFGVIQYIPRFASMFDIMFTNNFGTPFDTGAIVFLVLLQQH